MAAERYKPIDVRHGYIPGDPNAILENLGGYTRAEDDPVETLPIVPYEGWNFLPTAYGYRSYFGTNSTLDITALNSRCNYILQFRGSDGTNRSIALCEDGIWWCNPGLIGNPWIQIVAYAYSSVVPLRWTFSIIGNNGYFYREGNPGVDKITTAFVWSNFVPTFLTMASQVGIFQAGGRLGFWDSANSISWSSVFTHSDFTPSLETLAGNTKFRDIAGNIVVVKKQGDGFIIYATEGLLSVRPSPSTTGMLWEGIPISNTAGIQFAEQVAVGASDIEHYVYSSLGLVIIGNYNSFSKVHPLEIILTEVIDFLKEDDDEVQIQVINGRYVFFCLQGANYIDGYASSVTTAPALAGVTPLYFNDLSYVLLENGEILYLENTTTVPSTSFSLLATGTRTMYPTFVGALVYDLTLKKWGKYKGQFKLLLAMTPENSSIVAVTGYTDFGVNAGVVLATGYLKIFDNQPTDSTLRWGKIGMSRTGLTRLLTVKAAFRSNSTGNLTIDSSIEGRDINASLQRTTAFLDTRQATHKSDYSAAWHTVTITGKWDLQFMEFGSTISGLR